MNAGPYAKTVVEVGGIFAGVVEGEADTGDLLVRGWTGPREVVLPLRLANGCRVGQEIRYAVRPVHDAGFFVVTRVLR